MRQEIGQALLEALRASLESRTVDWTEPRPAEDWQALLRLAAWQKVSPMVHEAVRGSAAWQAAPPELRQMARTDAIRSVAMQAMQSAAFCRVYTALREAGVCPLVVKGIVCRSLYPMPDSRPSGDEDLLIRTEDFPACRETLLRCGLEQIKDDDEFEVTFCHPKNGLHLEVHKALFAPDSDALGDFNRFFAGAAERALTLTIEGTELLTLSAHDHLLFLLLHALKHFIHSGFGIRQVLDIGLWAQKCGGEVDWPLLLRQCREVRADVFAAAVFQIAGREFGIPVPPDWPATDGEALLEDILSGGIYGATDRSRLHSGTVTANAVEAQRRGGRSGSLLRTAFPGRESLQGRYPYLKRHPVLLPVAWVHRFWNYGKETARRGNGAAESLKTANRRLELLQRYQIID